ncbi:type IV pilin N-terminal domain-containing protein [Methanoregula sp. UBA64]|jgi:archaeal type IV pilus assembly protein PilA|uniref:type IV pilin N-terminal domain-containing protein n=1 Tax=Methanoregula sp. UBA64 TaxID=1915554 RepID=UPI0025EBB1B2|nr:type IV pilin N-terminal domain-containing protein [Methanoregula sp. UBA64]
MNYSRESAVSPVVGVMLMLIVVIIIAAVVSGFAGGLMKGTQSAPQLVMDVKIANNGYYPTSYFKAEVTSVSAPIKTSDLKIVTSWSNTGNMSGETIRDGSVVTPGVTNFNVTYITESGQTSLLSIPSWQMVCPQGDGPGVGYNGTETSNGLPYEGTGATNQSDIGTKPGITNYSWFGNYYLQAGTVMFAQPFGAKYDGTAFTEGYGVGQQWLYTYGTSSDAVFTTDSTDEMQAVLGKKWNLLRPGDIVNVKVIHIPSGKTIWQEDIPVEGSVI